MNRELSMLFCLSVMACGEKEETETETETNMEDTAIEEDYSDHCNGDPGQNLIENDQDCDGVLATDDCDDFDANLLGVVDDSDCDGAIFGMDCDDSDENIGSFADDSDCDGTINIEDCGDNLDITLSPLIDGDCSIPVGGSSDLADHDQDGVLGADDCDDYDPSDSLLSGDCDQDGISSSDDCDDFDASIGFGGEPYCFSDIQQYETKAWQYNGCDILEYYENDTHGYSRQEIRSFDPKDGSLLEYNLISSDTFWYEYDKDEHLLHYKYSPGSLAQMLELIDYIYDEQGNVIYFTKRNIDDDGRVVCSSQIRYSYDENNNISLKREYYFGVDDSPGNIWTSFHPNGEVEFYRNIELTFWGYLMNLCSYDSSGNLLWSSSVEYFEYLDGDTYENGYGTYPAPDCTASLSYEEIHSYLDFPEPDPLTDDGTSYTLMGETCSQE